MYHITEITENSKNIHEKLFGIKKNHKKKFSVSCFFSKFFLSTNIDFICLPSAKVYVEVYSLVIYMKKGSIFRVNKYSFHVDFPGLMFGISVFQIGKKSENELTLIFLPSFFRKNIFPTKRLNLIRSLCNEKLNKN